MTKIPNDLPSSEISPLYLQFLIQKYYSQIKNPRKSGHPLSIYPVKPSQNIICLILQNPIDYWFNWLILHPCYYILPQRHELLPCAVCSILINCLLGCQIHYISKIHVPHRRVPKKKIKCNIFHKTKFTNYPIAKLTNNGFHHFLNCRC